MRNRIVSFLTVIVMMFGMISMTAAPAAAGEGRYFSTLACESYDPVRICLQANWDKQADGTGPRLERFKVFTTEGCDRLRDYENVRLFWMRPGGGKVDYTYALGTENGCTIYRDVSNAGFDKGPMELRATFKADLVTRQDAFFALGVKVEANGSSDVTITWHDDVPLRNARTANVKG